MRETGQTLDDSRSSAGIFARQRMSWFVVAGMMGIPAFLAYRNLAVDGGVCASSWLAALKLIENIFLPRTNFEFDRIRVFRGCAYEFYTSALDLAILSLCTVGTCLSLRDAQKFPADSFQRPTNITLMSTKEFSIACLVFFSVNVANPPKFDHFSAYENHVDAGGIYFLKEGALIAVGYFFLSKTLINLFFSLFRVNRIFLPR